MTEQNELQPEGRFGSLPAYAQTTSTLPLLAGPRQVEFSPWFDAPGRFDVLSSSLQVE